MAESNADTVRKTMAKSNADKVRKTMAESNVDKVRKTHDRPLTLDLTTRMPNHELCLTTQNTSLNVFE